MIVMDAHEIKERIKRGEPVTLEEQQVYMEALVGELRNLKQTDSAGYLTLLKNMTSTLETLNSDMDTVTANLKAKS